jgi:hypothetical protein
VGLAGVSALAAVCAAFPVSPASAWRHDYCQKLALGVGLLAFLAALLLVLARAVGLCVEIWQGGPVGPPATAPLPHLGFCIFGLLLVTAGLMLRLTGDTMWLTAIFTLGLLAGTWHALQVAPFPDDLFPTGGRGPVLQYGLLAVGGALCALIVAEGVTVRRRRFSRLWHDPSRLALPQARWRGLDQACPAVGWLLIMLICGELAWPVEATWLGGGYRLAAVLVACVALASSAAMFALVTRQWRIASADVAAGLLTLAFCAIALCFVSSREGELSVLFPMRLNAMLVGSAVLSGCWNWLAGVWEQQLDGGQAWTTTGRLRGLAPRYALVAGLIGLFSAAMMGLWPRLPGMSDRDASFGRIAWGIAGHLLLILALMVGARRFRRIVFSFVAGGCALSLVLFVVMRVADFVPVVR